MPTEPNGGTPLPITAVIITLNEETNLGRCLASLHGLVSEIVVLDSGSTDRTVAVAGEYGARVEARAWQGYIAQKNAALGLASHEWALSLDADEEVSPELAASVRARFADGRPSLDGYQVNRLNFYLGAWVRHAWYPEWRLRLVRVGRASWGGNDPHERLEAVGPVGRLDGHLLHYSYRDLQDHLQRTIRYARLAADTARLAGRKARWYHLVFSPWLAFLKSIVLKQAWRDGWRGGVIAFATLVKVFAKYAFLLESQRAGHS
jgi:glycosyltransferase involved in cell wall biosynthesis